VSINLTICWKNSESNSTHVIPNLFRNLDPELNQVQDDRSEKLFGGVNQQATLLCKAPQRLHVRVRLLIVSVEDIVRTIWRHIECIRNNASFV